MRLRSRFEPIIIPIVYKRVLIPQNCFSFQPSASNKCFIFLNTLEMGSISRYKRFHKCIGFCRENNTRSFGNFKRLQGGGGSYDFLMSEMSYAIIGRHGPLTLNRFASSSSFVPSFLSHTVHNISSASYISRVGWGGSPSSALGRGGATPLGKTQCDPHLARSLRLSLGSGRRPYTTLRLSIWSHQDCQRNKAATEGPSSPRKQPKKRGNYILLGSRGGVLS